MRVIELQADAFKRLKAITIRPTTNVVEITGDNSEGKTSTLDALWAALGGKDAAPEKPIHTGAERAEVRLVLGENGEAKVKVTRRFKPKDGGGYSTDLVVESAEGARYPSPQGVLDAMVGAMCFDPLAFTRMRDEDQIKALRQFVPGVDFAQIEGLNKRDFDARTEVGRKLRDLKGQLAALPQIAGDLPALGDLQALQDKFSAAAATNAQIAERKARREAVVERIEDINDQIAELEKERADLQEKLTVAGPLPDPVDVADLQTQMQQAHEARALHEKAKARRDVEVRLKAAEDEELALTAAITKRKDDMAKAVQAAKMPIPGLAFGDGFVTLNGEPFAQASKAEQIRGSVAIAAAMNPKLRVARVMDGSLLDRKSWAALEAYAAEHDLQVWIETVSQHGQAAVLIEDGGVVARTENNSPEVEPVGDVV